MSWMQEKKDLPLFQYFLYKIAENDRKKILKKEDMIRKEKERESPEDWVNLSISLCFAFMRIE
jgi:hypothetical protein